MSEWFYPAPLVLVDLETTGARPAVDRITEVGLVQVKKEGIALWSSLINPCEPIPKFIQGLTGITDEMVATAPTFADQAATVHAHLADAVFVAHNARFDYHFLRNEFKRLGLSFRAKVLCTVQLSRALYPNEFKHSLDALVARHGLSVAGDRHRALTDALLIQAFLQAAVADLGAEKVIAAMDAQIRPPAIPPQLDESLIDELPETGGVYLFTGADDVPLYIGSSGNLRRRVLQHFARQGESLNRALLESVCGLRWAETSGEIGTQLLEQAWLGRYRPKLNPATRGRVDQTQSAWLLGKQEDEKGVRLLPQLVPLAQAGQGAGELYGPFRSAREAQNVLNRIIKGQGLCRQVLGLEAPRRHEAYSPCLAMASGECRGACIGRETLDQHHGRLLAALGKHRMSPWPYATAILIEEGPEWAPAWHVLDQWQYLGTVAERYAVAALLNAPRPDYDADMAKAIRQILRKIGPERIEVWPGA